MQVERLMRQLDDKDRELAAMEETLQLLAPEGPDGERMLRPDLSRSDAKRLESLQSWMSFGHNRSAERIKCVIASPHPSPPLPLLTHAPSACTSTAHLQMFCWQRLSSGCALVHDVKLCVVSSRFAQPCGMSLSGVRGGCRALEAQLLIAEQNATNYQAKLQELGLGAAELDAMAKPTSGESLILSGDEDNYLTSLVVKVTPTATCPPLPHRPSVSAWFTAMSHPAVAPPGMPTVRRWPPGPACHL